MGLKETISHIRSKENGTTFEKEYAKIEKRGLMSSIIEAEKMNLITKGEIDALFAFQSDERFKPREILNKFIHGNYANLFYLIKDVSISGRGKGENFEDFIEKMHDMDKVMGLGKEFTRITYAGMLLEERGVLFFLQRLNLIARFLFFERLSKLL